VQETVGGSGAEARPEAAGAARRGPPERLGQVAPSLARWLHPLWFVLFGLAIVGQAGGAWRVWETVERVEPAFARLGLSSGTDADDRLTVSPLGSRARAAGVAPDSRLLGIDGRPVAAEERIWTVAQRLDGPEGGAATLLIAPPGKAPRAVRLVRSLDAEADRSGRALAGLINALQLVGALLILPFLAAGWLLRRKAGGAPVPWLLAFAFVALAASLFTPLAFWDYLGVHDGWGALMALWFTLLLIALPTYPDGRFTPRFMRWMLVAAPVAGLASMTETFGDLGGFLYLLLVPAALWSLLRRYRATPRGAERQQIKWAAFGLFAGVGALLGAGLAALPLVFLPLGDIATFALFAFIFFLLCLGLLLMPLGLLLSLARWRLNDADAAIGRSAGYAAVTLGVGIVWAVSMSWANQLIGQMVGGGTAMATALSTLVAALVFVPARERVLGWSERRFQPALVRLRALPARLEPIGHADAPAEVAAAALPEIVDGVGASGARIEDEAGVAVAEIGAAPRDGGEAVVMLAGFGALRLGPRSDGASYRRDERAALAALADPLGKALAAAAARARRQARIDAALAGIEARLARLEKVAKPGPLS
jgi:hypothetical protein